MIKVAAIIKSGDKFCVVRKRETDKFIIPGGRIEHNETDEETLKRELFEELNVTLKNYRWFDVFNGLSVFENEPLEIRVYHTEIEGEPTPNSEIVELAWIGGNYDIPVGRMLSNLIIPAMIKEGIV